MDDFIRKSRSLYSVGQTLMTKIQVYDILFSMRLLSLLKKNCYKA